MPIVPSARPANARRGLSPASRSNAQIGRHQHRVERALAQKPARDIDELECEQEGVGDDARAEQRRDQRIAHEA